MKKLFLALSLVILTACKAVYKDVSSEPQYKSLLNNKYVLLEEMCISGVNLPPGYWKDINIYSIDPLSRNWTGPELISRSNLKKGTELTILRIEECRNCFDERIDAVVHVEPFVKAVDVPITIDLNLIESRKLMEKI